MSNIRTNERNTRRSIIPEHKIQSAILVAVSQHHCTIFRINTGTVKTADGRFFSSGTPNGYFDISGFRWSDGRAIFIEVKNERGRPRKDQIRFHHMLTQHRIIHGLARSTDDAVKIVSQGLIGYGFNDYGGEHV